MIDYPGGGCRSFRDWTQLDENDTRPLFASCVRSGSSSCLLPPLFPDLSGAAAQLGRIRKRDGVMKKTEPALNPLGPSTPTAPSRNQTAGKSAAIDDDCASERASVSHAITRVEFGSPFRAET